MADGAWTEVHLKRQVMYAQPPGWVLAPSPAVTPASDWDQSTMNSLLDNI